jgi:peptidoglycan/xylan/chitin deacetylase (PgdA/CDA1 family)
VLLLLASRPSLAADPRPDFWPDHAQGALSLTFDDGMPSQLDQAVPLLNRLGLKATFYVNPGLSLDWEKNVDKWRALAQQGHELGNHTDKHPCSCQSDFRHGSDFCLEKLPQKEIERTIDDAERALAALTAQPASKRSFAYPCYNTDFGTGASRMSYVPLVAKRYPGARVGFGPANDPQTIDLWYVSALAADTRSADGIIAYIDEALRQGHWAVVVFHGIGAEWNVTTVADFQRVMQYVAENRTRLWIAPFAQVANYVRTHRAVP